MSDIILPLRLDAWTSEPNFITTRSKGGDEMIAAEFPDTDGEPVFAVEDGEIQVSKGDKGQQTITLLSDADEGRSWVYSSLKASVKEGDLVEAGDEIGRVNGSLRLFTTEDDVTLSGSDIPLPQDPIAALDDLNALPISDDIPDDIDTADERRSFSESLFTGRKGKVDLVKTALIVAGAGLAGYGLYKMVK